MWYSVLCLGTFCCSIFIAKGQCKDLCQRSKAVTLIGVKVNFANRCAMFIICPISFDVGRLISWYRASDAKRRHLVELKWSNQPNGLATSTANCLEAIVNNSAFCFRLSDATLHNFSMEVCTRMGEPNQYKAVTALGVKTVQVLSGVR